MARNGSNMSAARTCSRSTSPRSRRSRRSSGRRNSASRFRATCTRYDTGYTHYLVTVVDYSNVEKLHADRVRGCTLYPDQCNNPYVAELRGAMEYAVWQFLKRDGKVTYYAYGNA